MLEGLFMHSILLLLIIYQLHSMDNSEANQNIMRIVNSASIRYDEDLDIVQSYLDLSSSRLMPQPQLGQLRTGRDALDGNRQVSLQSEPMNLQNQEISEMVQVQGIETETGLTAHDEESSTNHSSTSQPQSAKHNMPTFLVRNFKKLIKTYLKSAFTTQAMEELNQLYLKFVLKNLKESLKSLNSFWFTPSQAQMNEQTPNQLDAKFKYFLQMLKRPELLKDTEEEWIATVKKCQNFLKSFILSHETELLRLAQDRKFSKESRKTELYEYSERFLTSVKEGTPRGKDVKARRSTQ